MADAIAEKQQRAYRARNTPQQNEKADRNIRERLRKQEMLDLLKNDSNFREAVRKILSQE